MYIRGGPICPSFVHCTSRLYNNKIILYVLVLVKNRNSIADSKYVINMVAVYTSLCTFQLSQSNKDTRYGVTNKKLLNIFRLYFCDISLMNDPIWTGFFSCQRWYNQENLSYAT